MRGDNSWLVLPLQDRARWLAAVVLALLAVGFIAIGSASIEHAAVFYQNPFFHVQRYLLHLLIAVTAAVIVLQLPLVFWERTGWLWLLSAIVLLVLVLIPGIGREVNGSRRWLNLGIMTVQVSELAKLFVVVYLAGYLVRRQADVRDSWTGFLRLILLVGMIVLLLLLQPDFGAAVVIVATALGMLFLAGARLFQFLLVGALGVFGLAALVVLEPYRVKRLTAFTDPWADQFNTGYQLTQSLIAFGRGEWFGVGLGNSVQKLFYLPEAHTDFIFAIWAEEFGLLGSLFVIGLFVVLVGSILRLGRRAELAGRCFGAYLAYGAALLFSAQVFINIGVSSGLLPTKGLTLPFISYGGSSLLVSLVMIALVLRLALELPGGSHHD